MSATSRNDALARGAVHPSLLSESPTHSSALQQRIPRKPALAKGLGFLSLPRASRPMHAACFDAKLSHSNLSPLLGQWLTL